MIEIFGKDLRDKDKNLILEAIEIVLGYLVPKTELNKLNLKVYVRKNLNEKHGCVGWVDRDHKTGSFKLFMDRSMYRKNVKISHDIGLLRDFFSLLFHELVHIKQFLTGETFETKKLDRKNITIFKGKEYKNNESGWKYYESPWEIEAYGRMHGLWLYYRDIYEKRNE